MLLATGVRHYTEDTDTVIQSDLDYLFALMESDEILYTVDEGKQVRKITWIAVSVSSIMACICFWVTSRAFLVPFP
jgi:hypothetical protein